MCKFADGLHRRANSDVPSIAPQSIEDQLTETISLSAQLLDEWNHRLKNNLQILIRLLESGYRKPRSSEAREVLSDAIRRIGAIGTAQRAYYCARGCTDVNGRDLVSAICAYSRHQFQWGKLSASHSFPMAVRAALDHPTKSDFVSKSVPKAALSRPRHRMGPSDHWPVY